MNPPESQPSKKPGEIVVFIIRHEHTRYDELLMQYGGRQQAREMVHAQIEKLLARWESPAKAPNHVSSVGH